VTYGAGWATVPDDLACAAIKFVQAEWTQGSRDPLLRRVRVEGVSEREYWVDPTKESVIPAEVVDILERGGYVLPAFPPSRRSSRRTRPGSPTFRWSSQSWPSCWPSGWRISAPSGLTHKERQT